MSNRACPPNKPLRLHLRISFLGASLCSLLALMACAPKDRPTGSGGSGGMGTGTGEMATGTGGATTGTTGATTTGTGGANPCDNVDPDCECVGDVVVARDVDKDLEGSRLCEAAPGADCDDGDPAFVKNECGGCNKAIGGKVGNPCGTCGLFQCQGDSALQCLAPVPTTHQCVDSTVQVCSPGGNWTNEKTCSGATPFCVGGKCGECLPGTHKCAAGQGNDTLFIKCLSNGAWESSWTSCYAPKYCPANQSSSTCVGMLFHVRDLDFEVPRLLQAAPDSPALPGLPTRDVLDRAMGFAFG